MVLDRVKQGIRVLEALLTPAHRPLAIFGTELDVIKTFWWDECKTSDFAEEIQPYFEPITGTDYRATIIDAGAAGGLFSLAASLRFPAARIVAFEPSRRQQVVLKRNARRNRLSSRISVEPFGLWSGPAALRFRSHGFIGALEATGDHLRGKPFSERARVTSLDDWSRRHPDTTIDLVKMDIEGAELEALQGAAGVLRRQSPELLVQAYHLRNGVRTFERCSELLTRLGYRCREVDQGSGFLHAVRHR